MKTATATQTGPTTYCARWSGREREVSYRFLLALASGGYRVEVRPNGWGGRRQVLRKSG